MINLRNLSLQRGTKLLLNNTSLTLHTQQKVGIIGKNGCGKSSLLALLYGGLTPDSGDVDYPKQLVVAHVAQETPAVDKPALEYVLDGDAELRQVEGALQQAEQQHDGVKSAELYAHYEAIGGYSAPARAAQLLYGLGFSAETEQHPVTAFSGGWRMRLNLAQALMCRSDLLLLDEPTNHLDLDAVLWLEQWLKHYTGTLLLISHDREFLDSTVASIVHVEQQQLKLYTGNYAAFEKQRAEQLAQQQAAYQQQQREIQHMQAFVNRFRAKATKARQAQSRLKALQRMELISAAHVDSAFHFTFPEPAKLPDQLLYVDEAEIGYQATQPILKQVSLRIRAGSRIGLLGPNGAGKSTLIKLLAGQLAPQAGECQAHEDLRIGYFTQHQLESLDDAASPLLHVQRLDAQASEQSIRNFLGGFGFIGDMALDPVAPFSGGEKARLALALLVWQCPNLLLLDEPTNHLDLEMRHALNVALQDYQGALVVVSHDRHLLQTTTDELWLIANGQAEPFQGDLQDYRQWLLSHRAQQRNEARQTDAKTLDKPSKPSTMSRAEQKRQAAEQRERRRPLQNRLKKIEQDLDAFSLQKAQLEQQLADPALYDQPDKLNQCLQQQADISARLAAIESDWLTVTEALEALAE